MRLCWLFHRWEKWKAPTLVRLERYSQPLDPNYTTTGSYEVDVWRQERCCARCGVVQYREVSSA